jgi:hypothetical protein
VKSAYPGDKLVYLSSDITEWMVGDTIVFGASNVDGTGFEKGIIAEIDGETNSITLETGLEFFHYGSDQISVGTNAESHLQIAGNFGGGIDMRCVVGHVTRNIRISGSEEDLWGGHL